MTAAVGVNDATRIRPAVEELYTFLSGTYLPVRFPSMFKMHRTDFESGMEAVIENLITHEIIPTRASSASTSTYALLTTLGRHLDEDFLFLLPEDVPAEQEPKYVLEAYVSCAPAGFNPAEKLGKKLADIHGPVPGYAENWKAAWIGFLARWRWEAMLRGRIGAWL